MREIKIQMIVGKAEVSILAPILGQYGFNLLDFCKKFNQVVLGKYKQGTFVKVRIKMAEDRSITVVEEGIVFHSIVKEEIVNKSLKIDQIYNLLVFYCYIFNKEMDKKILKTILGTVRSMEVKIIEEREKNE